MYEASTIEIDESLWAHREPFDRVPVVDVAALTSDHGDKQVVARDIRWALTNTGFMYIKNHGVDPALIDAAFAQTRAFFALPHAEKLKLHMRHSGPALRGYLDIAGENTAPGQTEDLKECIDLGPEYAGAVTPFHGPNPWPDDMPVFRETMTAYLDTLRGLARQLMGGIALSLDLKKDYFEPMMKDPVSIHRLLHYPPQTGRIKVDKIGIGAHTDYGCMTILAQDDVGGLQVLNRDSAWVEVPPIDGTFVINIGDMMQRLTNDLYLANYHRAINTGGRDRYSMPLFFDVDYETVFEPLPNCVSTDNPARYEPIVCGEHKFRRYAENVADFPIEDVPA